MERKRTNLSIDDERLAPDTPPRDDAVMAWAVDATTNQPRYILELDATRKGKKCNCKCPSCQLPLTAVNAGKLTWQRRPHFRHPEGALRENCLIIAARKAVNEMFGRLERIVLPRRRRSQVVEGLSGHYHDAWVERSAEAVCVSDCAFDDEANALLTLDDGRRLHVRLVGRGEITSGSANEGRLTACIDIQADDPAIAEMTPEEILARIELVLTEDCWVTHWADGALAAEAEALARAKAIDALDWLDVGQVPEDLSPVERRETLLHREVKAILERERRIRVPELRVEAEWQHTSGVTGRRTWSCPAADLRLSAVELEVHLGHSVPDVVASWEDGDRRAHVMLIEVTVTNVITDERIGRLATLGWPVLEIDISRMGGSVTRDELARLVLDEVAGKRWLHHPVIEQTRVHLIALMQQEEAEAAEAERQRLATLAVSAADWAGRYLEAFRRRWQEHQAAADGQPPGEGWHRAQADVTKAVDGLMVHGYPASLLDDLPLRAVIARILSLQVGAGIEYRTDLWGVINAILCDRGHARRWHTLYLIALKTWPPALTARHQEKVDAWRDGVVGSIRRDEPTYVRETTWDRLIGLLFPEMQELLAKPFGTPLYHFRDAMRGRPGDSSRRRGTRAAASLPSSSDVTTVFDAYDPFESHPWFTDASRKPMLLAAREAAGRGLSPGSFARDYGAAPPASDQDATLRLLIDAGLAKTRYEWSWEWDRHWVCTWK